MKTSRLRRIGWALVIALAQAFVGSAHAQQSGGIRGTVFDADFNAPLAGAEVVIAETRQKATVSEDGNFVFEQVPPGIYTLVFTKEGFQRRVRGDVVVTDGQMTELEASLFGDFTDLEEYIVQDVESGSKTEIALLALRLESPALMDSISSDFMKQAGVSDAASALNLVTGATVAEGKYAVIRGLPDRYVNSQINGVRLPSADPNKRAVELDLFPAAAIDSIQVSKTFTPDQQGDASGGAVNVVLKKIPDETVIKLGGGSSYRTGVTGSSRFLTYKNGGVNYFGIDDGGRDVQLDKLGHSWDGAVGVIPEDAPINYKWSIFAGGKHEFNNGVKIGGLVSFFYERDTASYDDGVDDKYWVEKPGHSMSPQYSQGTPQQGDFKTSLYDVAKSTEIVKWGGLGAVGIETENNSISLSYLYTRVAESVATLAEDTRGKAYYFPGYDPNNPKDPGNIARDAAPYLRLETLDYTERTARTLQLHGDHKIPIPELKLGKILKILRPEVDWTLSHNIADLHEPDKRQFGSIWYASAYNQGFPPYVPPFTTPEEYRPYKPAANFTLGNEQRIWKAISEEGDQYSINLKLPFEQWTGDKGYLKFGVFKDDVDRRYYQQSFSNFNDNGANYQGSWDDPWSAHFPLETHPLTAADIDVDYKGKQVIDAYYWMAELPLTHFLKLIGGARYETTKLSIINTPEKDVTWIPPGTSGQVTLNPGDADVTFKQRDMLPSIGFVLTPIKQVTLRGSYTETVARPTFKELTPIQQQEFLGGDVFIGNPTLQMSAVKNYDLRLEVTPREGTTLSGSYFVKDITNPIEYVQRISDFDYTTAVNYPKGKITGYELEVRQEFGRLWSPLQGLTLGANGTFIDSEVTLPLEEQMGLSQANIMAPTKTRRMTNAPNHLYNLYMTYDMDKVKLPGTQVNVFYTVRGDTLVAGAGQAKGNYLPDVFEKEFGTLNVSLIKKIGENGTITLAAKNLLNPMIEKVYRSKYIEGDVVKTSYQKGIEISLGFNYSIPRHTPPKGDASEPKKTEPAKSDKAEPDKAAPAETPASEKTETPAPAPTEPQNLAPTDSPNPEPPAPQAIEPADGVNTDLPATPNTVIEETPLERTP